MVDQELSRLERELTRHPRDADLWTRLLSAAARAGRFDRGMEVLQGILERYPGEAALEEAFHACLRRVGYSVGGPSRLPHPEVDRVAVSPDGAFVASASAGGELVLRSGEALRTVIAVDLAARLAQDEAETFPEVHVSVEHLAYVPGAPLLGVGVPASPRAPEQAYFAARHLPVGDHLFVLFVLDATTGQVVDRVVVDTPIPFTAADAGLRLLAFHNLHTVDGEDARIRVVRLPARWWEGEAPSAPSMEILEGTGYPARVMGVHPSGDRVLLHAAGELVLFEPGKRRPTARAVHQIEPVRVGFSTEGARLGVYSDFFRGKCLFFDGESLEALGETDGRAPARAGIGWMDGGRSMASLYERVRIWSVPEGTQRTSLRTSADRSVNWDSFQAIAVGGEPPRMIMGSRRGVQVMDLRTRQLLLESTSDRTPLVRLGFSWTGTELITLSENLLLRTWDFESGRLLRTSLLARAGVSLTGTEEYLPALDRRMVEVRDAVSGVVIYEDHELDVRGPPMAAQVSRDGRRLLMTTNGGDVLLVDLRAGEVTHRDGTPDSLTACGFLSGGGYFAYAPEQNHLYRYPGVGAAPQVTGLPPGAKVIPPLRVREHPAEDALVVPYTDAPLIVPRAGEPAPLFPGEGSSGAFALHPDGGEAAHVTPEGRVERRDLRTGEPIADPALPESGARDVAYSPDGRWLLHTREHYVRLRDLHE